MVDAVNFAELAGRQAAVFFEDTEEMEHPFKAASFGDFRDPVIGIYQHPFDLTQPAFQKILLGAESGLPGENPPEVGIG